MGKSLKELREKRDALIRQKNRHLEKIETALQMNENFLGISHWEAEIEKPSSSLIIHSSDFCFYKEES